jgi:hypothetical protein
MDLRRRGKNRVVEAMARIVPLLPKGEEPARPNCDVDVDWVDSVPEGFNESIEPRLQRVSPFRIALANSFDDGFDLDQGGRREEQGVLMRSFERVKIDPERLIPSRGRRGRDAHLDRSLSVANAVALRFREPSARLQKFFRLPRINGAQPRSS